MKGEPAVGLAWRCDAQGTLLAALDDDFRQADRARPGASLAEVVDGASAHKAQRLLATLAETGVAFDWELNVPFEGRPTLLYCNAARLGPDVLVVGATTPHESARRFYQALLKTQGDAVALLRAVARERAERLDPGGARADTLYNELSRLNNELTAAQRELFRQNAELERLNAQKNYFLGMAAHELRNPLSAIRFYSDFLRRNENLSEAERDRMLGTIYDSSGFMLQLIEDLLTVSKIEAGRLELHHQETDLVALAERCVAVHRLLAQEKNIALRLEAAVPRLPLLADAPKLEQVVGNLLSNAVKFSPAHTDVTVRVERPGTAARLAVADQGPGIPPDERDHLFEPFQTTSVQGTAGEPSTGLGLAISRRIVEGHGGRLWVESTFGHGATFYVELPA